VWSGLIVSFWTRGLWSVTWYLMAACSRFSLLIARMCFLMGSVRICSRRGRGGASIPASVMASILVLRTLHDLSDRETAEAARCDLRWKVATGMALDHTGCDPSTLVYWRKRLTKSTRPQRINRDPAWPPQACGGFHPRRRGRQPGHDHSVDRGDPAGRTARAWAAEQVTAVCSGHDYRRPGKP